MNYDKKDRFDNLLLYSSAASACVRDLMQALKRVRHIKNNKLYYSTYPHYFGKKHFGVFSRARLTGIIEGREDYLCTNKLLSISRRMQPWMKHLWVFNTQEDNVSAFLHEDMLHAYLEATGYTIEGKCLEVEQVDVTECCPSGRPTYEDIDTIDDCGYDRLRDLLHDGRASTRDKLTWAKAHFQQRVLRDWTVVNSGTCASMFSVWLRDQTAITERLDNIRREKDLGSRKRYEGSVFQDNQEQKLAFVQMITKLLELPGSYAVGETVSQALLEASAGRILDIRHDLQEAFQLRIQEKNNRKSRGKQGPSQYAGAEQSEAKTAKDEEGQEGGEDGAKDEKAERKVKRALEIINQVLSRWGFTELRLSARKKGPKVDGKRPYTGTYMLQERRRHFEGFATHAHT